MSTILKKLHNDKEEGTLRISGTPYYEKIEGIGAIYSLRIRSGNGRDFFGLNFGESTKTIWGDNGLVVIDSEGKSLENASDEDLDKNYSTFLKALKENIIDYGSIVQEFRERGRRLLLNCIFPNVRTVK